MIDYPTIEEVNELLEEAESYGFDEEHHLARPLYFAASGSLAEANAYHALLAEVGAMARTDPYRVSD